MFTNPLCCKCVKNSYTCGLLLEIPPFVFCANFNKSFLSKSISINIPDSNINPCILASFKLFKYSVSYESISKSWSSVSPPPSPVSISTSYSYQLFFAMFSAFSLLKPATSVSPYWYSFIQ